jgi:hypothetical protein
MAAREVIHFPLRAQLSTRLWVSGSHPSRAGCEIPDIKPNLTSNLTSNPQLALLCLTRTEKAKENTNSPRYVRRPRAFVSLRTNHRNHCRRAFLSL